MKALCITILFLFVSAWQVHACRFTVREIGFSILSQDIYTVAVIDANAKAGDALWKTYHKRNRDCNVRLEVLNPKMDVDHPVIKNATQKGLNFPCTILISPDGRIFKFDEKDISSVYDEILNSGLGGKLRIAFPDVFAVVVWVEGEDANKNKLFSNKVNEDCSAIENIMPNMPKVVKEGPLSVVITVDDFQNEKLLLWSLGIENVPESPLAFVLYGRGRKIGKALNYDEVQEGGLYKYMSMIGADCECGLDKKWMLGNQVPLLWNQDSRQYLAKLVGFDVDNPMILAEMSRILAKESLEGATGSVAFAPETIDLDEVFGTDSSAPLTVEKTTVIDKSSKAIIYTLGGLLALIVVITMFMFFRKRD